MNGLVLAAALLLSAPGPDTTIALRQGDEVVVQSLTGELLVRAWNRSELRVRGEDGDEADVTVRRSGNRVVLRPDERRGSRSAEVVLNLPPWVELVVGGRRLDVTVEGMEGGTAVENVEGDMVLRAVTGPIHLTTVEGEVTVRGVRGSVRVNAEADDVFLQDVVGDVWATTGSGSIDLIDIDGANVHAETVSGDVTFVGRLQTGGTYAFSAHSGDADVTLPADVSARVSVSTFDGEFESDFPVKVAGYSGGRTFDFTLGDGAARLSIRVFDGEIRIREGRGVPSR